MYNHRIHQSRKTWKKFNSLQREEEIQISKTNHTHTCCVLSLLGTLFQLERREDEYKMVVREEEEEEEKSRWWWFESHKSSKHSLWLQSTLAELDAKTKSMLKLIEGNADSFAQRAETYYKKRPELVSIVEDFYRAHRSLAERFDHLKSSDYASRSSKFHPQTMESVCDSNSHFEDADSEIEDPDHEDSASEIKQDETCTILEQERLKLIQETHALRKQLLDKDDEKREVIRQLSLTLDTLKDDNLRLKRRLAHESLKKRTVLEFKPIHKLLYLICDGDKVV